MIKNLGNRIVNNYLIQIDDGYILVDTGYENGFAAFRKRLAACGVRPEEIRYVFLTHAHDDHAGFLNNIMRITDAPVIVHPEAVDRLKRGQNSFDGGCSSLLAYLFCRLMGLFGKGEHKYPAIEEAYLKRLVTIGSEAFKRLKFPGKVIETPGHTADHISLLIDGILFCGDAAMNGFPSIKRTIIWIEDLNRFRESWKTIIALDPNMIYPAHGKPFKTGDLDKCLPYLDKVKLYPLKP